MMTLILTLILSLTMKFHLIQPLKILKLPTLN